MLNLISAGIEIIKRVIPDKEEQLKAQQKIIELEKNGELNVIAKQASIITAEAKGESWLQRNWRPIIMMSFAGLVIAKWLGMTDHSISQEVEMKLMDMIKMGMGGYIVGRSAEKCIKEWKKK